MSELTLVKQSLLVTNENVQGAPVSTEQIVAITPDNEATIPEYGHTFTGEEQEELLILPGIAIDSLVEFYKQTRAKPVDEAPRYSCHTFVYFTLGAISTIGLPNEFYTDEVKRQYRIKHLKPAQAYLFEDNNGAGIHSVLGINRPAFNLSVDGDDMPLRIYANPDSMRMYKAKSLHRYRPVDMTFVD